MFAIQDELAEQIVAQLKSKLSPIEKAAIERKPTVDLAAYDLYVRGKVLIDKAVFNEPREAGLREAVRLLEQAVRRDPSFALAFYQLAHAHDQIYFLGYDHTQARLALADAAIQSLNRLQANSGEAHLALAKHLYWGFLDYDRSRQELSIARSALPNDPLPLLLTGYIDRRQGHWEESLRNMEHALELDPRNFFILQQISVTYRNLRRYPEMTAVLDRALAIAPNEIPLQMQRAEVALQWRADTKPLHSTIEKIITQDPKAVSVCADVWLLLALYEHDADAAKRALAAIAAGGGYNDAVFSPAHGARASSRVCRVTRQLRRTHLRQPRLKLKKPFSVNPTMAWRCVRSGWLMPRWTVARTPSARDDARLSCCR